MSTTNYQQSKATSARKNQRVFKKSFFRLYSILFVTIPFFLFAVLGLFAGAPESRTIFLITAVTTLLFSFIPFVQVNMVKVEPNKLTITTFFEEKVISAQDVKEIKVQSIRGRYGRVTQVVQVILAEGKNYPIGKFKDKPEVIYEFLMQWWNHYRNQ